MRTIKKLEEHDLRSFAGILVNAYPVVHTNVEDLEKRLITVLNEDVSIDFYGLFEHDELLGGMRFNHYTMNLFGKMVPIAGVGSVAVDLLHKKERVAKDLMTYFLEHFRKANVHFLSLYPFRLEFYKKMGFGIGTKKHQYRIQPASLPKGNSKSHIRVITLEDQAQLKSCFNRFVTKTHGMFMKTEAEFKAVFDNPNIRAFGYVQDDEIKGYVTFVFKRTSDDNFLKQNLHVIEMVYETPEVLSELLTFLHSQADQMDRIIVNTQDDYFHHLLADAGNGSDRLIPSVYHESNTSGIGLMYRVNNVKEAMAAMNHRNFGGQTLRVKITVMDSFFNENQGSTVVHFEHGTPTVVSSSDYDVEIKLDISDFSSLILGVIPFASLYRYGLIQVSDPKFIEVLERLFLTTEKPICMSAF